jgi:hypothetical protein
MARAPPAGFELAAYSADSGADQTSSIAAAEGPNRRVQQTGIPRTDAGRCDSAASDHAGLQVVSIE